MHSSLLARLQKGVVVVGGALSVSLLAVACGSSAPTTVVDGTIDSASFPSAIDSVVAEASDGSRVVAVVDASHAFALVLPAATYKLSLVGPSGATPIVLAGGGGQYATSLNVTSAGASASLGKLRFMDQTLSARSIVIGGPVMTDDTCTDGVLSNGDPCIGGDASVTCEEHEGCDGHGHGGKHHGHHDVDDEEDDDAETDDDGPTTTAALETVAGPIAVPEFGVSSSIGCGGEDGDDEDEDEDD